MGSTILDTTLYCMILSITMPGTLQELSGYMAGKKPLELLIDYHNFWARTVGVEAMVVDKDQDMSMDRLYELVNQVANMDMASVWETMVARGQTVTVTEISF